LKLYGAMIQAVLESLIAVENRSSILAMELTHLSDLICVIRHQITQELPRHVEWSSALLSHPKISILECEPFFKRNSKFLKEFIYFHFIWIYLEFKKSL
jgi:hypothetical protein